MEHRQDFQGLLTIKDTCALYSRYENEIRETLYNDAEGYGQNILEFIASFTGAKDVKGDIQLKNLLVWYMAEKTAWTELSNTEVQLLSTDLRNRRPNFSGQML